MKPTTDGRLKHPRGLSVLFFTEMWERFSFYGMRALLVLYLTAAATAGGLGMDRADALRIVALYTGLVYVTPVLGGFLADRYLGKRKAILIGGVVMALGHFAMAFEPLLNVALGLLIVGNGFFKPNVSTMVGDLYPEGDSRKDDAYTFFYMGINLGAFFSPIVCGTLGEKVGWHYGFGAAGIGMVFGLIMFMWRQKHLGTAGLPPGRDPEQHPVLIKRDWIDVALYSLASSAFVVVFLWVWPLLSNLFNGFIAPIWNLAFLGDEISGGTLFLGRGVIVVASLLVAGFVWRVTRSKNQSSLTLEEWLGVAVIFVLAVFSIAFWTGFEQASGTLSLFAEDQTDRNIFGWDMPASLFQSVNPLLIIVMSPLFVLLWSRLDATRFKVSPIAKQGVGLVIAGFGFVLMYMAGVFATDGPVSPLWLVGVYFLLTTGELCLSPVGLSLVNKLSPARIASMMMALWLMSSAVANYMAGTLEHSLASTIDAGHQLNLYFLDVSINLWSILALSMIGAGVGLLLLTPVLRRALRGRDV